MTHGFYRIGQASKTLGVSSYHLRRLCEAGAIEAELTPGNQWRVPISEVTRLEHEGVPPIPQRLPDDEADDGVESENPTVRASEERRSHVPEGLYAEPSDRVITAAEEVTITENRLRKRRLERELEEEEDFFRERAARVTAEAAAAREKARKEQQQRKRQEWEAAWLTYALDRIPRDAPRDLAVDVHTEVVEALVKLQPDQPIVAARRIIEGAVERALAPWRSQIQQQRIVVDAINSLPYDLRCQRQFSEHRHEAARLATIAVQQCPPGSGPELIEAAAIRVLKPIGQKFEHERACQEIASWIFIRDAISSETDEAKEAVRLALLKLPTGCPRSQMERARDAALAPLIARVEERVRAEAANASAQRKRRESERRVDWELGHIERYLDDAYEYDRYSGIRERLADARRLKEIIRPALIQECMNDPAIDDEDIRSRVEELVDEYL